MLKNKKLGFLGGGNMAEAMIKGLVTAGFIDAKSIFVSDPLQARLDYLHQEYKVKVSIENRTVTEKCDILILAVKPQVIVKMVKEIHDLIHKGHLLISVAAGIPISVIEDIVNIAPKKKIPVIRTMPNTPALVQAGVTAVASSKSVSKSDNQIAHRIFEAIGRTVDVPEESLDAVTGLSGSGPAYIFMVIEALSDAGVKMGLSREVSNILTMQTVLGSAELAIKTGKHPGELKDMVTSPGGTTISGLHSLEAGGLRTTLMDAVEEATLRSAELGEATRKKQSGNPEES